MIFQIFQREPDVQTLRSEVPTLRQEGGPLDLSELDLHGNLYVCSCDNVPEYILA